MKGKKMKNARSLLINVKMSRAEKSRLVKKAKEVTNGNLSELLREAALAACFQKRLVFKTR